MEISTQFADAMGCLALFAYVLTLLPGYCRVLAPSLVKAKALEGYLKNPNLRRQLGILAFFLALAHALPIVLHRRWAFDDPMTYAVYWHGILLLLIFTALAVTSNRWSQKKLKKDWKKLHELTYSALFLLTLHSIEAMWGKWDFSTVFIIVVMITLCSLFFARKAVEHRSQLQPASTSNRSSSVETRKTNV